MKITKRSAPPPRDPENRQSIEALVVAVNELTGAVGSPQARAVRVGEAISSGLLVINENGELILSPRLAELEARVTKLENP